MVTVRCRAFRGIACVTLVALAACAREAQDHPDQMSWARAALERNERLEIVAADPRTQTFTVRLKDSGELRMVRADQLSAAPAALAAPPPPAAAKPEAPSATAARNAELAKAGEAAVAEQPAPAGASEPAGAPAAAEVAPPPLAADTSGGRVLESGPGYSIKAAAPVAPAAAARMRDSAVTTAAVERRHEPIVCQGQRMLQIDNRNIEFDGDAVSAQDGCEIHITNSHISATGVGVSARAANVHIDNSLIEGDAASIDASDGAQVYASSSRFRGLSRRVDTATFHDLGGNIWN
jgi:hypothetical protein